MLMNHDGLNRMIIIGYYLICIIHKLPIIKAVRKRMYILCHEYDKENNKKECGFRMCEGNLDIYICQLKDIIKN